MTPKLYILVNRTRRFLSSHFTIATNVFHFGKLALDPNDAATFYHTNSIGAQRFKASVGYRIVYKASMLPTRAA